MREIKFRGMRKSDKVWLHGALVDNMFVKNKTGEKCSIIIDTNQYEFSCNQDLDDEDLDVFNSTIGQFTGLKDKNGKEIYEGDIVRWGLGFTDFDYEYRHRYAVVQFDPELQFKILYYINSKSMEKEKGDDYVFGFSNFAYQETELYLEIIGNIHENPELLK